MGETLHVFHKPPFTHDGIGSIAKECEGILVYPSSFEHKGNLPGLFWDETTRTLRVTLCLFQSWNSILKKYEIDEIVFHAPHPVFSTLNAWARIHGIRTNYFHHISGMGKNINQKTGFVLQQLISSKNIAVSDKASRVFFRHVTIRTPQFRREISHSKNKLDIILCVGRICPEKRQIEVLRAFFSSGLKNFKLIFVGSIFNVDYAQRLQKEVEKLNLKNQVLFTGPLKHELVLKIMQNAKITVLYSRNEAFGRVIQESIQCNTLTVAHSSVGAIDHIDSELLTIVSNREQLSRTLSNLLDPLINLS